MNDDIVTRLRKQNHEWLTEGDLYEKNWQLWIEAADEIERLRKVEANRDMWRNTCTKLVGMMLPFSLLMNPKEQKELTIILREAKNER